MFLQSVAFGGDFHALLHRGQARGLKLVGALNFNQAEPACAHVVQPVEMAESWNRDVILARHLQNGLAGTGAHFLLVDDKSFDICFSCAHATTSFSELTVSIWQTPAG